MSGLEIERSFSKCFCCCCCCLYLCSCCRLFFLYGCNCPRALEVTPVRSFQNTRFVLFVLLYCTAYFRLVHACAMKRDQPKCKRLRERVVWQPMSCVTWTRLASRQRLGCFYRVCFPIECHIQMENSIDPKWKISQMKIRLKKSYHLPIFDPLEEKITEIFLSWFIAHVIVNSGILISFLNNDFASSAC